jgi:diphthamide biosynthesis protein 2
MSSIAPVLSTEPEYAKVDKVERTVPRASDAELTRTYNLLKVAEEINKKGYKRAALQFPDGLLEDSVQVAEILEQHVAEGTKVYILADTSYSPCCVDEVAAKHVHADVIIHFGTACLTPSRQTPVIYVIGDTATVDVERIEIIFRATYPDHNARIVLFAETQQSNHLKQLYSRLKQDYSHITLTLPSLPAPEDHTEQADARFIPELSLPSSYTASEIPNRVHEPLDGDIQDHRLFYMCAKDPSSSLVLHLSTLFSDVGVLDISAQNPEITTPPNALQKRYRYMNIARTASTIGILVNTLSLRSTEAVLQKLKSWITGAGKKHYTFVVGKPNVPKLANFDVVDIWVIIGCSVGGIIVNCDDYYKPIITPYELNLALMSEISWTGQWLIDFEATLSMSVDSSNDDADDDEDANAPQFDVVSGRYVSSSRPLRRLQHVDLSMDADQSAPSSAELNTDAKTMAERMASHLIIRGTVSTAAEYLQTRMTWKGLGSDYNEASTDEDGAKVKMGRSGLARGYAVGQTPRT